MSWTSPPLSYDPPPWLWVPRGHADIRAPCPFADPYKTAHTWPPGPFLGVLPAPPQPWASEPGTPWVPRAPPSSLHGRASAGPCLGLALTTDVALTTPARDTDRAAALGSRAPGAPARVEPPLTHAGPAPRCSGKPASLAGGVGIGPLMLTTQPPCEAACDNHGTAIQTPVTWLTAQGPGP